jgi:hypothetical protein
LAFRSNSPQSASRFAGNWPNNFGVLLYRGGPDAWRAAAGKTLGAQGIAAETPQDLRGKSEELERKARFFAKQKMRQYDKENGVLLAGQRP